MTHDVKSCMDRPRKVGAKWTSKHIAPDEKIETFELDYDGKRDRWNGYDASTYSRVIERYEARDEARRKFLKDQQLKKLEEKNNNQSGEAGVSDEDDDEDDLRVDEAKVDESKQMDFAKVEKRVRTTGGGSTGTVRSVLSYIVTCLMPIPMEDGNNCFPFVLPGLIYNYVGNIFTPVCWMLYIIITEVYIFQELAYSGGHCKISVKS
jgi:hypothetical protein